VVYSFSKRGKMKDKKKTDYNINLSRACKILQKSKRTISRYIKSGWLNPEKIKSKQGTLEYRFNRNNLLKFKKPGKTENRTEQKEQTRPESDIVAFLKDQIKVKDEQIKELQERSRETNITII